MELVRFAGEDGKERSVFVVSEEEFNSDGGEVLAIEGEPCGGWNKQDVQIQEFLDRQCKK